jgi:toxin FitB
MYLLDNNVVSELRKAKSGKIDKNVLAWANSVATASLYLSAITIMELETGVLLVERRDPTQGAVLRSWLNAHVLPAFSDRVLPVDTAVAQRCAKLHVPDPHSDRNALIAATALVHGMTVITRNVEDFVGTKVEILNPWEGG